MVGRSESTESGRNLPTGGNLMIGNYQTTQAEWSPDWAPNHYAFGGELYKLNIFSKELSSDEVREMAKDMCSFEEESHKLTRIIRWEEILLKISVGNVSYSRTTCMPKAQLLEELQRTEGRLRSTMDQLRRTIERNSDLAERLSLSCPVDLEIGTVKHQYRLRNRNVQ